MHSSKIKKQALNYVQKNYSKIGKVSKNSTFYMLYGTDQFKIDRAKNQLIMPNKTKIDINVDLPKPNTNKGNWLALAKDDNGYIIIFGNGRSPYEESENNPLFIDNVVCASPYGV